MPYVKKLTKEEFKELLLNNSYIQMIDSCKIDQKNIMNYALSNVLIVFMYFILNLLAF